jgi:anti-sigma B factor antagonist
VLSVETVGLDEHRAHVRVIGDLDVATGAPLWAVLDGHLAAGRRYLRLDLSGVSFIDAATLSGFARIHHSALADRGRLLLTGVRPRIARVMRLGGLDHVLFISALLLESPT